MVVSHEEDFFHVDYEEIYYGKIYNRKDFSLKGVG